MSSNEVSNINEDTPIPKKYTITIFVMLGLFLIVALVFFYGKNFKMVTDLKSFYGTSFSNMSIALIIAFLVSDVVSSFNHYLMVPVVQSMFPGNDIWQTPVNLPRNQVMYPGLFFQAIVSFVMSIIILFAITWPVSLLLNGGYSGIGRTIVYVTVVLIILGLTIWNVIEISNQPTDIGNINKQKLSTNYKFTHSTPKNIPFIPTNKFII